MLSDSSEHDPKKNVGDTPDTVMAAVDDVVDALVPSRPLSVAYLCPQMVERFVDMVRGVLFPEILGHRLLATAGTSLDPRATVRIALENIGQLLTVLLQSSRNVEPTLCSTAPTVPIECIVAAFLKELPELKRLMNLDVDAILLLDVAVSRRSEVVLAYPGVLCLVHQRMANALVRLGDESCFPRMLTQRAHQLTGIDIHPNTTIGERLFIDHGTGVVIGGTAIIGNDVSLYQGVTLGARTFPRDETGRRTKNLPRHPIVEDGVIVYANATVLGRVRIGKGAVIGGNAWVVEDVPPKARVVNAGTRALATGVPMFSGGDLIDGAGI